MKTKVQFQVQDGSAVLNVFAQDGTVTSVSLDGTTRDGTPRIDRLAEKLQRAADRAAAGKNYRYALKI
jgi:hypothetical protein